MPVAKEKQNQIGKSTITPGTKNWKRKLHDMSLKKPRGAIPFNRQRVAERDRGMNKSFLSSQKK